MLITSAKSSLQCILLTTPSFNWQSMNVPDFDELLPIGGWSSQHLMTWILRLIFPSWKSAEELIDPQHIWNMYTFLKSHRYGGLDDSHRFSFLNMCDFEVNQPFVHYKVMIMYKVGLPGGTSFNIWYMAIIKWWIFHTVLLKIPAVMLLVFFSIHPYTGRSFTIYIHTQTGSTISNDQSQDETHQNTPRKINVVPQNHPVEKDNHRPTIIFRFHVRCTHHNAQHPMTQYPSNTIPMNNFLITVTNGWIFFLKDHWRWN